MDVFSLKDNIIPDNYARYAASFIEISEPRVQKVVREKFDTGLLWPEPLLQLNPALPAAAI